jgi:hypothetical protein
MSFTDNIRNIEKVKQDLREYCEKVVIPKYDGKYKDFSLEELYNVIEYSLLLAEDLYLDANLAYVIAVYHQMSFVEAYDTNTDNNFDTMTIVKNDQHLLGYFTHEEVDIIASAVKENEGENDSQRVFTSLYSKVISDADAIGTVKAELLISKTWRKFFDKGTTNKEVFDLMYEYLKANYSSFGNFKLVLKASYELVKSEWNRTKRILDKEKDVLLILQNLLRFSVVKKKDDETLNGLVRTKAKEILADNPLEDPSQLEDDDEINMDDIFGEGLDIVFTEATAGKTNRQKAEALIFKVLLLLDKTGVNVRKYKEFFGKMSDEQFDKYMKNFLKDEDENFYLEILPNKNEPTLKQIKSALDVLKVPTDEYVFLRHEGHKDDPIRTAYKVPVGYITIKRVQQILSKKNTYSLDIAQRNMKTGQVTGHDKIARISDIESYSLVAIGAESALKEFLGPRADNSTAKTDMYKDINMYGYSYLKDMGQDITENQTLNTLYVFLMGAGLGNDLLKEDGTIEEILQGKINKLKK